MNNAKFAAVNILEFEFSPGPHTRVHPLVDRQRLLDAWDLHGKFVPLSSYELTDPIFALNDIYLQCEKISIESFYLGSCICGFTGCGSVLCDITLEAGEMIWASFRTSDRVSLPHVGPFRFDWDQVVTDLQKARDAHSSTLS